MGDFEIDGRQITAIAKRFPQAAAVIGEELTGALRAVGADAERGAKLIVVTDRGFLKGTIRSEAKRVLSGAQVAVKAGGTSEVDYAQVVEKGRRAGAAPPPSGPIASWLARNGGEPSMAFVVARRIGRRGIRARPYLKPSVERALRESGRHMRPAIARIRARLQP